MVLVKQAKETLNVEYWKTVFKYIYTSIDINHLQSLPDLELIQNPIQRIFFL